MSHWNWNIQEPIYIGSKSGLIWLQKLEDQSISIRRLFWGRFIFIFFCSDNISVICIGKKSPVYVFGAPCVIYCMKILQVSVAT